MTKVKMRVSVQAYNDVDGINDTKITTFVEGLEYDIGKGLLDCFISMGVIDLMQEKAANPVTENKAIHSVPSNKKKK